MSTLTESASTIMADIRSANDKFERHFAAKDAAAMSLCYTEDGSVLPTGATILTGTDAIRNFWQMVMGMGITNVRLATLEVDQQNDTAIETGHYELLAGDGKSVDQGKYIVVWKRQAGAWKLHKDIWNTNISSN